MSATAKPQQNSYTVKQAALFLNISTKSVRRLIDRGFLRCSKVLGKNLIPGLDVETLVERTC